MSLEKENKKITDMNYSEFSLYIDENCIEPIMSYDGFEVYEIDGSYYFYECEEEGSSNEFFEITPIATLTYHVNNDLQVKDGDVLHTLFNCVCCGEVVNDNYIEYIWFDRVIKENFKYTDEDIDNMIETWMESFLQINLKTSKEELTYDEIKDEIEETKGTIENEKLWALSDPIHYENIKIHTKYLEMLEDMLKTVRE